MSQSTKKHKVKKHLSAEELKSQLYAHFEEIGSLEQIKAQLRGELYTKLLKRTPNAFPETTRDLQNFDKMLLPLQVSNWLVFDHLLRQDYQYTLSTFTSEAKLSSPEKLLTACDVLRLFGLENTDSAYRTISRKYVTIDEKGIPNSLLLAVVNSILEIPNKNFRLNELFNETKEEKNDFKGNSDYKDGNYRKNIRTRIDDSLSSEKASLALLPQLTADNKHTEQTFHEQLQSIKNEKEREVQKLREKLLEELDKLRAMQLELEHEKNNLRQQRTSISHDKEVFQEKKMILEQELESKFKKEMMQIEMDFKSQLHIKETENDRLQRQNLAKEQKLFELEMDLRNYKERCNDLEKNLTDQREMYNVNQEKYSSLLEENIRLQKNFEGMSDYSIIKDELSMKVKENIELQNKLKKAVENSNIENQKLNETVGDLEQKLKTIGPELLQAQKELHFTKETLQKQETFWDRERKKLEQELQNSKQMYKTVFLKLEEHREDIQDLHKTIHFLEYQISNTFPVNKTKYEMLGVQQKSTSVDSTRTGMQGFRSKNNKSLRDFASKYRENASNFISESRDNIDRLLNEAEIVKEKCSFVLSNTALQKMDLNSITPKTPFGNIYSLPTSSFMNSTNSRLPSHYFDNLVKNEMSFLNLKPATNIKRMVSNPQFSSNLFSYSQQNEQIRNRNDPSSETTVDGWKEQLKELQKEHAILDDSCSEKEGTSIDDYAKERENSSNHLFNSSTKVKTLPNKVSPASLNYDFIVLSETEANNSSKNNENVHLEIKRSKKISKDLGEVQEKNEETSSLIEEGMTASGTQNTVTSVESQWSAPVSYENTPAEARNTPPLPVIDLDVAWKQNKNLTEIPKKLDTVSVLGNTTLRETKDSSSALNFAVDLDAAWRRRKSSIADLSFQNSSHNLEPQNKVCSAEKNKSEPIPPKIFQKDSLDKNYQNMEQDVINNGTTDIIEASLEENEHKTAAFDQNVSEANQNLDVSFTEEVANEPTKKESGDVNSKSSIVAHQQASPDIAINQNENKSLKSGSGSELSDVHLSCGSEQEVKDDDFW